MIANSHYAYASILREQLARNARWLDLGCGHQFLPAWMPPSDGVVPSERTVVVGIDRDRNAIRAHPNLKLRIVGDIERLPLASGSFDLITANMVLEHVVSPEKLFREVSRVLAPNGTFLIHTPNLKAYSTVLARCVPASWRPRFARLLLGRDERDVYPTFYRGNTAEALAHLAAAGQLRIVRLQTVLSSAQIFRLPGVKQLENRLLQALANDRWARWRPCIIAEFARSDR
jgi:SAM-dependent methyltransferase